MNEFNPMRLNNDNAQSISRPVSGTGIGLRSPHIHEILTDLPSIPWFELLADNHLVEGGLIPLQLEKICQHYPVTFHSVGLSLGSVDPLDLNYLGKLKKLMRQHGIAWLSEHCCFTSVDGFHSHDLLPVPYSEESLSHMVQRILQAQDFLGEQILIENVSSYMKFAESTLDEVDFISELAEQADCLLLIDVNNIYVNHINQGLDTEKYLSRLPYERIKEVHLAGFEDHGDYILDAHNNPVAEPVWQLYEKLIKHIPEVPTLIEWDNDIPSLQRLVEEAQQANAIANKYRFGKVDYAVS
jgi:uncharacterized protein (UPF0276 family)